ncbi:MAG: hypothetical protein GC155_06955 [Alphaproteobacteria bacterium]|nr:hypothetical protein [Alphaproteobacteria bacterium]
MTPEQLARADWQYLGTVGVARDPPGVPRLLVQGINGGSDFTVGLLINDQIVRRLDGESVDDLTARVRRDMLLRGHPDNEAVTLYSPHVAPKPICNIRFGRRPWMT